MKEIVEEYCLECWEKRVEGEVVCRGKRGKEGKKGKCKYRGEKGEVFMMFKGVFLFLDFNVFIVNEVVVF